MQCNRFSKNTKNNNSFILLNFENLSPAPPRQRTNLAAVLGSLACLAAFLGSLACLAAALVPLASLAAVLGPLACLAAALGSLAYNLT